MSDYDHVRDLFTGRLRPEGIELTAVPSGIQGLRNAQRESYELIILDVMLPGLSGFDVLKQIKAEFPKLPVLILSMHLNEAYVTRALQAGEIRDPVLERVGAGIVRIGRVAERAIRVQRD